MPNAVSVKAENILCFHGIASEVVVLIERRGARA
jgi:hypothetical protein